jgi:hypothetical protein
MRALALAAGTLVGTLVGTPAAGAQPRPAPTQRPPIIDVHLHASPAASQGPPPVPVCPGTAQLVAPPRPDSMRLPELMECASPLRSPTTDDEIMRQTLTLLERYNVVAVTSGSRSLIRRWKAAAPARILPSFGADNADSVRAWAASREIVALGELGYQYSGLAPGDSVPERAFALAEQLDLPVGLHMGLGPPGAPYIGLPRYRMRLSNPLLLEETLIRHPRLRLYVMHAGWPFLDEMVGLMWAHPQVYVDVGVISWALPRREFHQYLRRLVDAGFGKRIMFGSDNMIWPDAVRIAIENVEAADFLSAAQKRDIFYNNAARFLRLPAAAAAPARAPVP